MRKHLSVAALTLGLTVAFVAPAQAATHAGVKPTTANSKSTSTTNPPGHYKVVSGDNLSEIAHNQGLDSWRPLWNANIAIKDPDLIYPGQDLVIPNGTTADRPLPKDVSAASLDASYQAAANADPRPVTHYATRPAAAPVYASGNVPAILARVKMRESGGNYATNTGNGYYGAYQFDLGTWRSNAPAGYANMLPSQAPPAIQDEAAATLYARRGCSPWPNTCY